MIQSPPPFDPYAPHETDDETPPPFNPTAQFSMEGSIQGVPATIDESVRQSVPQTSADTYHPGILPFQRLDPSRGVLDSGEGVLGYNLKYSGSTLVDAIAGTPKAIYDTMIKGGEAALGRRELTPEIALDSALLGVGGGTVPRVRPGAVVSAVTDAVKSTPRVGLEPKVIAPTRSAIREASSDAYKVADDAGVIVTPKSFSDFVAGTEAQLTKGGVDKTLHPDATAAFNRLKAASESGEPQTLQQIEILRRVANAARNDAVKEGDASRAGSIVKSIDEFINNIGPEHLVAGDADRAVPALQVARDLWRKNAKMGDIQDILDVAERIDSPEHIKQQFRKIAKNTDRFNQYSPEEQKLITDISRTGVVESVGKLAPDLSLTGIAKLGAYGAGALANPAVLALPAAGMVAKRAATSGRQSNVKALLDLIATGEPKKGLVDRLYLKGPDKTPLLESPEVMGGKAVDHVLSKKEDYLNAMERPDVPGRISFRWGNEKHGFQHILADHGEEAARNVPTVIAKGKVYGPYTSERGRKRINIYHDGSIVSLSPDYHGEPGHWVITAYRPDATRLRPKK